MAVQSKLSVYVNSSLGRLYCYHYVIYLYHAMSLFAFNEGIE